MLPRYACGEVLLCLVCAGHLFSTSVGCRAPAPPPFPPLDAAPLSMPAEFPVPHFVAMRANGVGDIPVFGDCTGGIRRGRGALERGCVGCARAVQRRPVRRNAARPGDGLGHARGANGREPLEDGARRRRRGRLRRRRPVERGRHDPEPASRRASVGQRAVPRGLPRRKPVPARGRPAPPRVAVVRVGVARLHGSSRSR